MGTRSMQPFFRLWKLSDIEGFSLPPVIGQCVQLGLRNTRLDLGCLLLWLHPDTDPWGLPGQPLWTQVAVGVGSPWDCNFYTANPFGC